MDVSFLPIYVLVMKVLGIIILIIGSITLYLITCHSGRCEKQYKAALLYHQFLLLFTHAFLCLCYIPVVIPPYVAIYPAGYLKDFCPSIVLLIFQLSVFLASVTTVYPLFHFRLLAVLPSNHFIRSSFIFYPLMTAGYLSPPLISPIILPFAYMEQDKIKAYLAKSTGINDSRLFDNETVALTFASNGLVAWTVLVTLGTICFVTLSIVAAVWTLSTLNNLNIHMSQKTRIIQKKLTISLIIQTVIYNLLFVGIAGTILTLVYVGYAYTVLISVLFWLYSSAYILGCILLVGTDDKYKQVTIAACCFILKKSTRMDSAQVVPSYK